MMDTKAPLAHPPADLTKRTATVRGRSSLLLPLLHTGRSPDANAGEDSGLTDRGDQVAAFGSAVLAIRWCMTVASVAFAAVAFVDRDWGAVVWGSAIVSYTVIRTIHPIRCRRGRRPLLQVMFEIAFHAVAVAATGHWESLFVPSLMAAIVLAGFARGSAFGLRVAAGSSAAISLAQVLQGDYGHPEARSALQWTLVLVLIGGVAGFVRRMSGEADRQHSLELGEVLFVEPEARAIADARWAGRLEALGADEERTRIARDLHDNIGQSLACLAFELDRMVSKEREGEDLSGPLEELRSDLRNVIGELRDTLFGLRTDVSEHREIGPALQQFAGRLAERANLEIHVHDDAADRLPLRQEREMRRIAQEALLNVERHAHATTVDVRWRCDEHGAILEIDDDGLGFPDGRAGRVDSYGILGMRERASSIGATLEIGSEQGRGTVVRCVLPVGRSDAAVS